jgi:hypothetical protein
MRGSFCVTAMVVGAELKIQQRHPLDNGVAAAGESLIPNH